MRHVTTSVDVDAPVGAVRETLTALDSYPDWNPHVTSAVGVLAPGARLRLRIERVGASPADVPVAVTAVDPERYVERVGTVGHRPLFEGRHSYELDPLDDGRTRLHNREAVPGPARPVPPHRRPGGRLPRDERGAADPARRRTDRRSQSVGISSGSVGTAPTCGYEPRPSPSWTTNSSAFTR